MEVYLQSKGAFLLTLLLCSIAPINSDFSLQAFDEDGCFPKSSMRFNAFDKSIGGLTELETHQLIKRFKLIMTPIVKTQLDKDLIVTLDWEDASVGARTTRDDDNNPVIMMLGGMARHPEMTRDGLLTILCHEIGHHLGGAPKKFRGRTQLRSWSSAEGQSDYYASLYCLPKIFNEETSLSDTSLSFPKSSRESVVMKCGNNLLCQRIALAGLTVGRLFASLKDYYDMPSFQETDPTEVWETNYGHATPQCRLDTILAGANCSVSSSKKLDPVDPTIGTCSRALNSSRGVRPLCWYKPN